jgi:D-alanyl-lipoteichoic acid acyltransferase DltB (MBOAT superfamily)
LLFNSYEFIFAFLPITAAVFFLLVRSPFRRMAAGWLALASLFYYAWWTPAYLPLLLASIGGNYLLGRAIAAAAAWRRALLILGIGLNLAAIGWFKYAGFLADNLNGFLGTHLDPGVIVLPLAISFFTFQQIAYLVDVYRGEVQERGFVPYLLFVTFFPQLIAGPIVHHGEMMPQFRRALRFGWDDLAIGTSMFALGLFKKVVLADTLARYADPVSPPPGTARPSACSKPGWGRSPTPSSSISTSAATATWRWAPPASSASGCR